MMTSDAKRALAKTIRELREKIILPDLREAGAALLITTPVRILPRSVPTEVTRGPACSAHRPRQVRVRGPRPRSRSQPRSGSSDPSSAKQQQSGFLRVPSGLTNRWLAC
jgi:hypothetical protein